MDEYDLEVRVAALEQAVQRLLAARSEPLVRILEWLGEETRRDVARLEEAQFEERGRLLALDALLRAAIALAPDLPALEAAFVRRLEQADADLIAAPLAEKDMAAARAALRGSGEAFLRALHEKSVAPLPELACPPTPFERQKAAEDANRAMKMAELERQRARAKAKRQK